MKNWKKSYFFCFFALLVLISSLVACNKSNSGGKSFNSAEDLNAYLDKQPANSPDKPIRVTMTINDPMLKNVVKVITSAGKYVSFNISGNVLTSIGSNVFANCTSLVSITIPKSVVSIAGNAFIGCSNLISFSWLGFDSSLLNGTWVEDGGWTFKFSNGNYEYGPAGKTSEYKGVYFTSDGALTLFEGNNYSNISTTTRYSVNGNLLRFGNLEFTKQ